VKSTIPLAPFLPGRGNRSKMGDTPIPPTEGQSPSVLPSSSFWARQVEVLNIMAQRGATLIEMMVVLTLVGVLLPLVLGGMASGSVITDNAYDRSVLFELAQSQMEEIQRQPYQVNAANYTLIAAPAGYSVSVASSVVQSYTYPAPLSTATQETVQRVTITVTGVRGNYSMQAYKVRR